MASVSASAPATGGIEAEVIRYMADTQDEHFARLGLPFAGLRGRRRLQLIDCQNLFCEVGKYARVAHPEALGISGRTRIKQAYRQGSRARHAPGFRRSGALTRKDRL